MKNLPLNQASIINILGIEDLPLEKKKKIVNQAVDLVEVEVFNRVMEKLNKEDKKKVAQAMEEEDQDKFLNILKENSIDLLQIAEEEMENLKQELNLIS